MIYTQTMNLLFRPGLRKDFRDSFMDWEEEWTRFCKSEKMNLPEISGGVMTGFSRMYEIGDGEGVTYEDPKMGPKVMAVDKEFGVGFIITRKAIEDDQYGKANQHAKWLGRSARLTYEYRGASVLDDAFAGTTYKGWDQKALCATDHTLIGTSQTFANTPSTQVGLSVTGITALLDLAQIQIDQNGDPIVINPDTMIIGNSAGDLNRAIQIWQSQLEPFTANNEENAIKYRMSMKNGAMPSKMPMVSHYKSSRKSYFMFDSKYNDVHLDVRRAVEFDDTVDFDSGALKYKATTRFTVYFVDPIGWYGSNPS
jgi:hypothetical protein